MTPFQERLRDSIPTLFKALNRDFTVDSAVPEVNFPLDLQAENLFNVMS